MNMAFIQVIVFFIYFLIFKYFLSNYNLKDFEIKLDKNGKILKKGKENEKLVCYRYLF
jgi:hypothetical protein